MHPDAHDDRPTYESLPAGHHSHFPAPYQSLLCPCWYLFVITLSILDVYLNTFEKCGPVYRDRTKFAVGSGAWWSDMVSSVMIYGYDEDVARRKSRCGAWEKLMDSDAS